MLTKDNYFSRENAMKYMSYSQYKSFAGSLGRPACEECALKVLKGEYTVEPSKSMMIGSYVDAFFSGEFKDFALKNNNMIFNTRGTKYADFQKADNIIARCQKDKLFMQFMSGEPQKIFTAELFGTEWKCKIDSYHENKCIVDLKVVEDIYKDFYVKDFGVMNFIDYWGYSGQLAVYQKIVELNTGKKLPCYIAAVDKTSSPAIEIIQIPDDKLKYELSLIDFDIQHILDVKNGIIEPTRCGKCDYCKETKVLTAPITLDELTGGV